MGSPTLGIFTLLVHVFSTRTIFTGPPYRMRYLVGASLVTESADRLLNLHLLHALSFYWYYVARKFRESIIGHT